MGRDVNCAATAECDFCGKQETFPIFDRHGTHFPYPELDFYQNEGWDEDEVGNFLCADCLKKDLVSGRIAEDQEQGDEDQDGDQDDGDQGPDEGNEDGSCADEPEFAVVHYVRLARDQLIDPPGTIINSIGMEF